MGDWPVDPEAREGSPVRRAGGESSSGPGMGSHADGVAWPGLRVAAGTAVAPKRSEGLARVGRRAAWQHPPGTQRHQAHFLKHGKVTRVSRREPLWKA